MPDRYYSAAPINGHSVTLSGNEAHHLLHVMRVQPGHELIIFDGQGGEFVAEVTRCQRSTVEIAVGERQHVERELSFGLTLAVALPKGDRQRWLIEKAVELGVSCLIPLKTARSISKSERGTKLQRYVIEASKQCGRNRLMEIAQPIAWPTFLAECRPVARLISHPGGLPFTQLQSQLNEVTELTIAVGPEGGFTDEEVTQAINANWQMVGLGERILRIETAALALASTLAAFKS